VEGNNISAQNTIYIFNMAGIEEMYKNFGILADAGDSAGNYPDAYQAILEGVKGDTPEKKLSCQFIPRFFKYFPNLSEQAIDAQLDLCEEDQTLVRRQAIKSLPEFCKDTPEHMPRITDILTQLLQQEDPAELAIVRNGLELLIKKDPKGALGGIFSQIHIGDDPVREKAIKFLNYATTKMSTDVFNKDQDTGQYLLEEIKKVLPDVTGEEFTLFISILSKVKSVANNPQNLADLITEQAELDKEFQAEEPESLNRLITCTRQAAPFFQRGASSEKYLDYIVSHVMPVFDSIPVPEDGENYKQEVLKLLADLSSYITEDQSKEHVKEIFERLIEYMPLPPEVEDLESEEEKLAKLNFSYVECLMFAFHKIGGKDKEFLASEESAARLKDFRLRLQYFSRQVQVYIKKLKLDLAGKTKAELEEEENKVKLVALRTCNNINMLIKDLFHNPPSYKSSVVVSWKSKAPVIQTPDESVEDKRKRAGITPISFEGSPKDKREKKFGVYTPPGQRNGNKGGVSMDDSYKPRYFRGRGGRGGRRGGSGGFRGRGRGRGGNYDSKSDAESFLFR